MSEITATRSLEQQIQDLLAINEALERMAAEIEELRLERDHWQLEYEELLECIGGKDPRHE